MQPIERLSRSLVNLLLINVRTLAIRFIIFDFTLASPATPVPKAGSDGADEDQPMRARKRSSERMAMAFVTRTMTAHMLDSYSMHSIQSFNLQTK